MGRVCLSQTFCRAHRVLVRFYLQEKYLVCPEVFLVHAVWRVGLALAALLQV
jgi:hypothetical protein